MNKTLYIVDGSSFLFRAYYGMPGLSNSKGQPTSAIYGFISILQKLMQDFKPKYLTVCFDRPEPTFRKEKYDLYKANRDEMPSDLASQIPYIKNAVKALNIPLLEKPGFEADDIMGTLATKAAKEGFEVFLVTSDKDIFQLVTDHVKVLNVHKNNTVFDPAEVAKKYNGVKPDQIIDMLALMGDTSDNIPGIPGVGEKTAIKLINEYGNIDNLYQHTDELKGALQKKVSENKELAYLSKDLVTIDCEVDIPYSFDEMIFEEPDVEKLRPLYEELEFNKLLDQLGVKKEPTQPRNVSYQAILDQNELDKLTKKLFKTNAFAVDTETNHKNPHIADLIGISICFEEGKAFYLPLVSHPDQSVHLSLEEVKESLQPIFENQSIEKFGQNIKYDKIVLERHGFSLEGITFDTMIASYLLNPSGRNHGLDAISQRLLGLTKVAYESLVGSGKKQVTLDQVELSKVTDYACEDADAVFCLVPILKKDLQKDKLFKLFEEVEIPLMEVLLKMERNGVHVDKKFLTSFSNEITKELTSLEKKIYKLAGREFNIKSTKQLGEILFDELKLPVIKKTKTGYSTDVTVLEKLSHQHKLPKHLLDYRELTKLQSTYVDALPKLIDKESKLIHSSFNQTITATGRLSSSDPNFQNIPIKTEMGKRIREAFVSRNKGDLILAADYSQIELRILAHLSEDKNLTKAFNEGIDVHAHTASVMYDIDLEEVDKPMRNAAKVINFSVIYGKTAYGLAQDLGMPIKEANEFIESYFDRYKGVKDYLDSIKEKTKETGFTETILGRRCYFPDIHNKNKMIRQFAERAAVNAPIQGSAADLIKVAMIEIQKEIEKHKWESKMILQVHDELVFDVAKKEAEAISEMVVQKMESAIKLKVPLVVDSHTAKSWAEAK